MSREALIHTGGGSTGSRSLLRRMNSLGLLRAVIHHPHTARELTAMSGLSRTAVDSVVNDLVKMGWFESFDSSSAARLGRPANSYRVAPGLGNFLAIDIGAHHIYAVVTDVTSQVKGTLSVPVDEVTDADERVSAALCVSDELLKTLSLDRSALWAVAIGSPGAISATGEVLHFGGVGMPGWIGINLRERFEREFESAVHVEGDVALGAYAELTMGAAQHFTDVVYVLCGVRTSGALIVNGTVHRGVHGAAGIVGEMPELRWARLETDLVIHSMVATPALSREQIFELAREGNADAVAAVNEFADDLATGAAAMTLAIDPQLVIIGGGSSPAADVFLPRFEETLRRLCPLPPAVTASQLGSEAVAMGGISLAALHVDALLETAVRDHDSFPSPVETLTLLRQRA